MSPSPIGSSPRAAPGCLSSWAPTTACPTRPFARPWPGTALTPGATPWTPGAATITPATTTAGYLRRCGASTTRATPGSPSCCAARSKRRCRTSPTARSTCCTSTASTPTTPCAGISRLGVPSCPTAPWCCSMIPMSGAATSAFGACGGSCKRPIRGSSSCTATASASLRSAPMRRWKCWRCAAWTMQHRPCGSVSPCWASVGPTISRKPGPSPRSSGRKRATPATPPRSRHWKALGMPRPGPRPRCWKVPGMTRHGPRPRSRG